MKSIKPGRGVSDLSHSGSVFGVIFGIIWTMIAIGMAFTTFNSGAPGIFKYVIIFFPIFGIMFIVLGVKQARFHKHNATQQNRYSIFDITTDGEERDPLDRWSRDDKDFDTSSRFDGTEKRFCSNCGNKLSNSDNFCPKCGKKA